MKQLLILGLLLLTISSYAQCYIPESNEISIISFQFIFEKIMPWFVALIIGFTSIIITRKQIKASKKSMNKQIETSVKIAQLEINKSVLSGNRQEWINTVRETASELVANLESFNIEFINAKLINKSREFKLNQKYTLEISKLGTRLELLLNPNENKTRISLDALMRMSKKIITDEDAPIPEKRNDYKIDEKVFIETIMSILKEEWERVKKGI